MIAQELQDKINKGVKHVNHVKGRVIRKVDWKQVKPFVQPGFTIETSHYNSSRLLIIVRRSTVKHRDSGSCSCYAPDGPIHELGEEIVFMVNK